MRFLPPALVLLACGLVFAPSCGPRPQRPGAWTPASYPSGSGSSSPSSTSKAEAAGTLPPGEARMAPSVPKKRSTVLDAVGHVPDKGAGLRSEYSGRRPKRSFVGRATYYHDSLAGNPTACGDKYTPSDFTAAHRTLPFGTILRVVHPSSGKDVYVRVNDRGPFGSRRLVLDLSRAAADELGLLRYGVMKVRAEILEFGNKRHGRCGRRQEEPNGRVPR